MRFSLAPTRILADNYPGDGMRLTGDPRAEEVQFTYYTGPS